MLLAAGRGERLRPLTDQTPKPLLEVRGKPLIDWHLEALARAGVREVVINLSWLGARIRAAVGAGARFGLQIHYSEEPAAPLETGGGIVQARRLLGASRFLLVNADTYTHSDFALLRLRPQRWRSWCWCPIPHIIRAAILPQDGAEAETGDRATPTPASVSLAELPGAQCRKVSLLSVLRRAIAARRLRGELFQGQWADVGSAERLAALNAGASGV
jgi:MurNAc alpha-1-phosphate uridylyltransferase